jgi:hypothetical protein
VFIVCMYVCMYVCDIAPTNGRMAGARTTGVFRICMYKCMFVCMNECMYGPQVRLGSVCMYICDIAPTNGRLAGQMR